jgi:hypothetical protein
LKRKFLDKIFVSDSVVLVGVNGLKDIWNKSIWHSCTILFPIFAILSSALLFISKNAVNDETQDKIEVKHGQVPERRLLRRGNVGR